LVLVPKKSNEFSMELTQNQQEHYDTQFSEEDESFNSNSRTGTYIFSMSQYFVQILIHYFLHIMYSSWCAAIIY
jgi:hypothetical protein